MDPTLHFDDDTKQRYQQALSSGLDPVSSLHAAAMYQSQKNVKTLGDQATSFKADANRLGNGTTSGALHYTLFDPESNANITKLAPLAAGAVLAPFSGGLSLAGAAALTGLGTGAAELARQSGNNESTDPLNALKQGILSGAGTYAGGALFNGAAGAVGKAIEGSTIGNTASKVGSFLNQDVGDAASSIIKKLVGNNTSKAVDITDAIQSLSPKDAQALLDSGHIPSQLASGDTKAPLALPANSSAGGEPPTNSGPQPRLIWNPDKSRVEMIDRGFVTPGAPQQPLPPNPGDINFGKSSSSIPEMPQSPVLVNPATGETAPVSQSPQALPANPAEAFGAQPPTAAPEPVIPPQPGKIEQMGNNIRQDINNPLVKASPGGAAKENTISNSLDETLGVGSAAQKYARMPQAMQDLQSQLETTLGKSTTITNAEDLKAIAQKSIESSPGFTKIGSEGARYQEEIQKVNEAIDRYAGKDGTISASDHYKLNQELASQAGKAFDKNSPGWVGADMTPSERANYTAWKASRSQIGLNNPEANPILAKEQALIEGAPGLKASRDKAAEDALKVFGVKGPKFGPTKQLVKDTAGAVVQKIGKGISSNVLPTSLSPATLLAGTDTASKLALGAGNPTGSAPTGALPSDPSQAFNANTKTSGATTSASPSPSSPFADPRFIQYLTLLDTQKTGGKNIDLINKIAKMFTPPALSTAEQTRHDNITTALTALDAVQQNLVIAGGAQGSFKGALANIPFIGQYINEPGKTYEDAKIETATQIAKAITGNSRVPAQMVQMYLHSLPDVTDTPEAAQSHIDNLTRTIIAQAKAFGYNDIIQQFAQ